MKKIFLFSGVVLLSGSLYFFNPFQAINPFPDQREFQVTYKASIPDFPSEAEEVKIWIPLASDREGQTILDRKIESPLSHEITKEPEHGNEMAFFELKSPFPESFNFEVTYSARIERNLYEKENGKQNPTRYLKPTSLMVINDTVRERTHEAVQGKETLIEKARGIYENVIGTMRYDKTTPGWGRGDTVRACLLGAGNCTDFHSLFISMAHAAEIPARFKIGLTIPQEAEGDIAGYHCWAEFYEEGKGWQPVDTSEAWKHPKRKEAYFGKFDTNKFLISVGRDIELVPKQEEPPLNMFFYPYVEVDGKAWNGVKTAFEFKNLKTEEIKQ